MPSIVLIGCGSFVVLLALVLALARPHPHQRLGAAADRAARDRALAAQADVEDDDIEQMIEARNAIRRRRGRPELADDLAAQLRRDLDGGPG
jgi:hypothetical protein